MNDVTVIQSVVTETPIDSAKQLVTFVGGITYYWTDNISIDLPISAPFKHDIVGAGAIDGVGKRYSAALVKVTWLDGSSRVYTLTGAQPTVQLYGAADDPRGMGQIFASTPNAYYEWHQVFKRGATYVLSIEVGVEHGDDAGGSHRVAHFWRFLGFV